MAIRGSAFALPLFSTRRRRGWKPKVKVDLLGSLVWLCGFFLFISALHFNLQKSTPPQQQQQNNYKGDSNNSDDNSSSLPVITIYAAPRPFCSDGLDLVGARQELAVRSWLALSPNVVVILFGQHPSILHFAATLGPRVVVESAIDFTFLGTPFFHSMIARSRASHSGISVLIDPETILLPDTISTLHHVHKLSHDWFLVSESPSISNFPFHLDDTGKHWLQKDGGKIGVEKLQEIIVQKRQWRSCSERLLMAWNAGDLPLHAGIIPSFLYGKGFHNRWLVNEVLSSDFRSVIDASLVISSFYPESMEQWFDKFFDQHFNKSLADSSNGDDKNWEHRGNHLLAALYGTLYFQPNKTLPVKLVKCLGQHLFINPVKSSVYSLQGPDGHASHSMMPVSVRKQERPWLSTSFLQSRRQKKLLTCVEDIKSLERDSQCSIIDWDKVAVKVPTFFLPFSLESLLQIIADKDKSVVLAVSGDNYRDMLMSWVCRLRHLAVKNFIVCALDPEIYQFSVLQGLPVFMDPQAPSNISFNDCHFGTDCFQRVTKVKSRIVLQILKLGYNVLLSDVDVYWFHNPLPFLHSFGPATLAAQSDEYNENGPINLPRRLNSGFYFARSDLATISAVERVVKHASMSGLSEQPSFYDVLCGEGGVNRVGDDQCLEPHSNLTVLFLDRNSFPNGAYKGMWEKHDVRSSCLKLGCLILHNNWISGRKRKLERQLLSGLWDYDPSSRMCLQSWQRTN